MDVVAELKNMQCDPKRSETGCPCEMDAPCSCEVYGAAADRIAKLEAALSEAVDEWASALNMSPSISGRKRLDRVRAVLDGQEQ